MHSKGSWISAFRLTLIVVIIKYSSPRPQRGRRRIRRRVSGVGESVHYLYGNLGLTTTFPVQFKINVLGFVHSVNTFLPLLRKGSAKKIVLIGSQGGERDFVWEARMPNMTAYSTTKAAAHMVMAKYAVLLEKEGFVVTSLCPGIVDVTTTASSECGSFTLAHIRGRIELIANAVLLDKQIWKKEVEAQQADFRKAVPDFKFEPQSPEGSVTTLLRTIAALDSSECGKFLSHGEQVAAQNQGKS